MKKYVFFLIFICLYCDSFAQNNFKFIQAYTPKEYFYSGNISYYFGYDGAYEFWIDNDNIVYNKLFDVNKIFYGKPTLLKLIENAKEVLYLTDGSIAIYRTINDYSCIGNTNYNCMYSPIYIRKINKKSLVGNISLYRIDKNIPLTENDVVNFPLGAELYSITIEIPAYDFSTFTDYESLVCIKNVENLCKGVINDGMIDRVALFELSKINDEGIDFLYKDAGTNLIYQVDLNSNKLMPYDKSCVMSTSSSNDIKKCKIKDLLDGDIQQFRHPDGFIYYNFFFNNPTVDNIIYWINNRGEPFKLYTNSNLVYSFTIFNNIAAKMIIEKLYSKEK